MIDILKKAWDVIVRDLRENQSNPPVFAATMLGPVFVGPALSENVFPANAGMAQDQHPLPQNGVNVYDPREDSELCEYLPPLPQTADEQFESYAQRLISGAGMTP